MLGNFTHLIIFRLKVMNNIQKYLNAMYDKLQTIRNIFTITNKGYKAPAIAQHNLH